MIKNGFLYCDQCGKPIKLIIGQRVHLHGEEHYCSRCTQPKLTLIQRFIRWWKGG